MTRTPARPWRRPVPSASSALGVPVVVPIVVHAAMLGGMVLAMVSAVPAAALVAALVMVVMSAGLGVAARTGAWAREAIIDLWAMALLLLTPMTAHPADGPISGGHHAAVAASSRPEMFAVLVSPIGIVVLWAIARLVIGRRSSTPRHSLATALVCAVQLGLML